MTPTPALNAAVCKVMQRVTHIKETGKNEHHGYKYASDEDLLAELQPAMADNGLALLPREVRISTVEHGASKSGKTQFRTDLVVRYDLVHASGEERAVEVPGCGVDPEDKGAYKAMTGALKYALRHTFLVPTGDDAERSKPQDPETKPAASKPQDPETKPAASKPQDPETKPAAKSKPATPGKGGPSDAVVKALAAAGWNGPVVEEIRDFAAWMGIESDPWAADSTRQAKLPKWVADNQPGLDAWVGWRTDFADTLRDLELTPEEVDAWCVANKRKPAARLAAGDRPKLIAYLRDAGGADKVRAMRKEAA